MLLACLPLVAAWQYPARAVGSPQKAAARPTPVRATAVLEVEGSAKVAELDASDLKLAMLRADGERAIAIRVERSAALAAKLPSRSVPANMVANVYGSDKLALLKADGERAIALREATSEKLKLALLKADGERAIALREATSEKLKLALLKADGERAIALREATSEKLKLALLKADGKRAIALREATSEKLKLTLLKAEGVRAITLRSERSAALAANLPAKRASSALDPLPPSGYEWGAVF